MLLALINITSLVYCEPTRARIWERPRINGRWNSAQEIMGHDFPLIWLTLHALKACAQHTSHCRYILLVVHCEIKLCTKVCTCLQASHNNKRRLAMRTACAGVSRTACADAACWLHNKNSKSEFNIINIWQSPSEQLKSPASDDEVPYPSFCLRRRDGCWNFSTLCWP
jgi:hypothetical protein